MRYRNNAFAERLCLDRKADSHGEVAAEQPAAGRWAHYGS